MLKRSKFKRMMSVILTLCMLASIMVIGTVSTSAKVIISEDGLWGYTVYYDDLENRQMVCIANYYGTETSISLPTEVDGYIPNEIGLSYAPTLKDIHIPKNYILFSGIGSSNNIETVTFDRDYTEAYVELQHHGSAAFTDCKNLKKVVLPNLMIAEKDKVDIIDDSEKGYHWEYVTGLLPSSLFKNCTNLEEIVLPDNIEYIGVDCFKNCSSLKTLTIPEGVIKIDESVFSGTNLEYLYLPSTVKDGQGVASVIIAPEGSYSYNLVQDTINKYGDSCLVESLINSTPTEIIGDVNGDNELNINDVTLMQKRLVLIYPFELNNYDINNDEKFNIWDATIIQRQLAQIE